MLVNFFTFMRKSRISHETPPRDGQGAFSCMSSAHLEAKAMPIALRPEQEARLKAHVETGDFALVEEAVLRQPDDGRVDELEVDRQDDLAWAEPYVDEARAAIARGNVIRRRSRISASTLLRPFPSLRVEHRLEGRPWWMKQNNIYIN
jgi:hypothetical protein